MKYPVMAAVYFSLLFHSFPWLLVHAVVTVSSYIAYMTSYIVTQTLYLSWDQFTSVQTYLKTCQSSSSLTIVLRHEKYLVFNNAVLVLHIILMFHMENKARIPTVVKLLTNLYLFASSFIACTLCSMWTSLYPSFRQTHHSLSFLPNAGIYLRFPSNNKKYKFSRFVLQSLKISSSAFQSTEACCTPSLSSKHVFLFGRPQGNISAWRRTFMLRFIVICLNLSRHVMPYYLNLDDQSCLSHPLQLIFYPSSYHWVL